MARHSALLQPLFLPAWRSVACGGKAVAAPAAVLADEFQAESAPHEGRPVFGFRVSSPSSDQHVRLVGNQEGQGHVDEVNHHW